MYLSLEADGCGLCDSRQRCREARSTKQRMLAAGEALCHPEAGGGAHVWVLRRLNDVLCVEVVSELALALAAVVRSPHLCERTAAVAVRRSESCRVPRPPLRRTDRGTGKRARGRTFPRLSSSSLAPRSFAASTPCRENHGRMNRTPTEVHAAPLEDDPCLPQCTYKTWWHVCSRISRRRPHLFLLARFLLSLQVRQPLPARCSAHHFDIIYSQRRGHGQRQCGFAAGWRWQIAS